MSASNDKQLIKDLKAMVADQQEEIWQLRRAAGFNLEFKLDLGLSKTEMKLFLILAKAGALSNERGLSLMASDRKSTDPLSLLRIHIHNMRRKLRAVGIEVKNRWGVGYYLDTETLARVRPMIFEELPNGLEKSADNPRTTARANGHLNA